MDKERAAAERCAAVARRGRHSGEAPYVLFMSNGHGEDTVGAEIAARLIQRAPELTVAAMPVVDAGAPYLERGIEIVGPTGVMPSGGLIWKRPRSFFNDVLAGFGRLVYGKIRSLRSIANQVDLVVGVGDKVILYLTSWFLKKPIVFVGLADSAYYVDGKTVFTEPERRIMRRLAKAVYARDALSASLLQEMDVSMASFVGNPMMDCIDVTGDDFDLPDDVTVIAILPGSRDEAYRNLVLILEGVRVIHAKATKPIAFVVALAGNLDLDEVGRATQPHGWRLLKRASGSGGSGVVAELDSGEGAGAGGDVGQHGTGADAGGGAGGRDAGEHGAGGGAGGSGGAGEHARGGAAKVLLTRGRFGDVIHRAEAVIGLSGTANEQAAGLGKPVITFPGAGDQITPRFVEAQTRLLGDAVTVTRPEGDAIAAEVIGILEDPARRERMGAAGRERMGRPGAADRIVEGILDALGMEDPDRRSATFS